MQVVILAGGRGTRMKTLAPDIPKCLIEVAGRPFADLQLRWLSSQGATDVLFSIGHLGDQVRHFVGDGSAWNLDVRYVDEGSQLRGTAGALRLGLDLDLLNDRFFVLYGDSYLTVSLDQVAMVHHRVGLPALMTVFRNEGRWEESNTAFDGTLVTRYEKHSASASPEMCFVDYGLSALSRTVVEHEVPEDTECDLAGLYGTLSRQERLGGFEVHDRFYEIGSPQGLRDLEQRLSRVI
jgi:MurNAc alpha-1-phosphate uridylyltransferase